MERLLALPLKPSRIALYLHGAVLLLSVSALLLSGLSAPIKSLLVIVLAGAGARHIQQQKQSSVSAIGFEQEQWWVSIDNNKTAVELFDEQLVLSWLVVLMLREKDSGKKFLLALWPDTANKDDLRRLRVFLRNV